MIRIAAIIIGVCCVAVVATESLGLAVFWYRGYLNADSVRELRLALTGQTESEPIAAEESHAAKPGLTDVLEDRSLRILNLDSRESELVLLKGTATETANRLLAERQAFDALQRQFEERLKELQEQTAGDAVAQTQAVLLALPPAQAVEKLMALSLDENVLILKGMSEKSIAKLLTEFRGDPTRVDRGQKIFEALSRGEPRSDLIEQTLEKAAQADAATAR